MQTPLSATSRWEMRVAERRCRSCFGGLSGTKRAFPCLSSIWEEVLYILIKNIGEQRALHYIRVLQHAVTLVEADVGHTIEAATLKHQCKLGYADGFAAALALGSKATLVDLETEATARRRFQTTLLTVFSAIAMLLAVIGVYGLLAFSVRRRTGEIGIRMALGSTRSGVVKLVLREGLALLWAGLGIGLAASLGISRLLSGFLYGVPAIDPLTYALVPFLLLVGTLAACLVPSFRAAGIDPMNALRHE